MDSKIIDGKSIAKIREEKLKEEVAKLGVIPKVVSILIGDDAPSILYTNIKQKKAGELGINFEPIKLPADIDFYKVSSLIIDLNNDPGANGIMIQLPVPKKFLVEHKTQELLNLINPKKDVDGLVSESPFQTAAVKAVFNILEEERIDVKNKYCVMVGSSDLIGKPIADGLKALGGMVKLCNSKTENLEQFTKQADILVSATGVPNLIKGDMVKEGVVVIDVGVMVMEEDKEDNKELENKKVLGDVEFELVIKKASKITPVPGGVGPVTVVSLLENVVESLSLQK